MSRGMINSDNCVRGIGFAVIPYEWNNSADGG